MFSTLTSPFKNAISSTSENVVNCGRLVVVGIAWKLFNRSSNVDVDANFRFVFNVVSGSGFSVLDMVILVVDFWRKKEVNVFCHQFLFALLTSHLSTCRLSSWVCLWRCYWHLAQ